MRLKLYKNVLLWVLVIYFFVFERVLVNKWSGFGYIDEIFALVIVSCIALRALSRKLRFVKSEQIILIYWGVIIVVGICGNLTSGVLTEAFPICTDMISMVKVWLAYYAIIMTNKSAAFYDNLIYGLAKCGRVLCIIMFICLAVSQFVDIGMTASSARYGIIPFKFIFNVPGNFSKIFYFLIPLLSADLYYESSKYKKAMIGLALVVWIFTLRSRAVAFAAVYVLLAILFFSVKVKRDGTLTEHKIKLTYIFPMVIIAVAISWKQIIFYFTTATQARAVLLRYGFITLIRYFPIGAGFGTFGSDVAATYYSSLYLEYGFNSIYGMKQNQGNFLNDNYWPMVMGQFGVIGTIFVLWILFIFTKMILQETKRNNYLYFASFCAMGFLLLSSIASKSYCEYSSICVFLLLGVFVKRERCEKKIQYMETKEHEK